MLDANSSATRVAILATSEQTQIQLANLLEEAGLNVVVHDVIGENSLPQLENTDADVLLVDIGDDANAQIDIIDTLLDYDSLPVFFNDSSANTAETTNAFWAKKIALKLTKMVQSHRIELKSETDPKPQNSSKANYETLSSVKPEEIHDSSVKVVELEKEPHSSIELTDDNIITESNASTTDMPLGAATNIWVLGASLGGPQAVRQFLAAIKADLPVSFILSQHIGANHISLLAEQLNRVTSFKVISAASGHLLRHHEVVLAQSNHSITITDNGYLSLSPAPEKDIYSPSIDNAITAVAKRYGHMAGAIIFSGMGDDGATGCKAMAESGGIIWAQNIESCVISSMPDQARKTNAVTFSANPQALADKLYQYYSDI